MSKRTEFSNGAKDTVPFILGAIPFGIIFGALSSTTGIGAGGTIAMSLFVFAGSAQFIAAGLVAQETGIAIIVLTVFIVNLRHMLYSLSLGPFMRHLPQRWLLPLGFWLTDETYAVTVRRFNAEDESPDKHWYMLGSALAMYGNWQLCTVIGVVIGTQVEDAAAWGLDFAMIVTFIGIVVPMVVNRPMLLSAVVAGSSAVLLNGLPHQLGLIVASVLGIVAGYVTQKWRWPHE